MRGIYFINDQITISGFSREESFYLQEQTLLNLLEKHDIDVVALNPYQIYNYYTILHALFYDLKETNTQLDCFLFYSPDVINDFMHTYPARWLLIKSYFNKCIAANS
ncbi:hypothetical protein [Bacillus sp. B15-48]|uniref:hypothetical protein n=1 Tax=Bacillus sp. B15-48 TaxID=1548601 RepID=UPI00193FC789|nr:hypothetical protein [Bacillus sp. B15-48]MBM4765198.1 hypothetical protein [Bacillus sp. B15-48]